MFINENRWKVEMMFLREKREILVCIYKKENKYLLIREKVLCGKVKYLI